ncbi:MAG: hypothetical protein JSR46_11655 [Verrucomicrobia bacterium]|nr:hypothetical protein [Verrucomicrobiota bacterium]
MTKSTSYNSPKRTFQDFEHSWKAVLSELKIAQQGEAIEEQSIQFRLKAHEFEEQATQFQDFFHKVSIVSAIKDWLRTKLADPNYEPRYCEHMYSLMQKKLIPIEDKHGKPLTLEYFIEHGHQAILESIRSVQGWTMLEKEEKVQCYMDFTRSLSRQTQNHVPYSTDPDRERVRHKAVSYETFMDFVPHLSERDALIAKLLYFGDVAMEDILSLQRTSLDKKSFLLHLDGTTKQLPRHLFLELLSYINAQPNSQKLAFTNVRGAHVDRTHLNQSFARACEKSVKKVKITPGTLLKLKFEQDK